MHIPTIIKCNSSIMTVRAGGHSPHTVHRNMDKWYLIEHRVFVENGHVEFFFDNLDSTEYCSKKNKHFMLKNKVGVPTEQCCYRVDNIGY